MAKAQELSDSLSGEGAFASAARSYSAAPTAGAGGRMDWLPLANLPPAIAEKMSAALADICTRQATTDQFAKIGNYYDPMSSAEFSAFVADQIEVWRPMIIAAGAAGQ